MYRIQILGKKDPAFTVTWERAKKRVELALLREYHGKIDHIAWTWSWVDYLYRAWLIYPSGDNVLAAYVRRQIDYKADNVISFPSKEERHARCKNADLKDRLQPLQHP